MASRKLGVIRYTHASIMIGGVLVHHPLPSGCQDVPVCRIRRVLPNKSYLNPGSEKPGKRHPLADATILCRSQVIFPSFAGLTALAFSARHGQSEPTPASSPQLPGRFGRSGYPRMCCRRPPRASAGLRRAGRRSGFRSSAQYFEYRFAVGEYGFSKALDWP